jgi:glycosyltransferase involved in cell wall biosynthesis
MGGSADRDLPTVSVVTATRDRPKLLERAVRAALQQDYAGGIECIVVFDQSEPVPLEVGSLTDGRSLRVLRNDRTPGLAGARNTGILAAGGRFVAFCDDDDVWMTGKLSAQVDLLLAKPAAALAATGIRIITEDCVVERVAPAEVTFADLLVSRVSEIHPSSFLLRRDHLLGQVGLLDEALPASYGEDYEFLLRAARTGVIATVGEPLVDIHWNRPSFFAGRWESIADGLTYILSGTPEFSEEPVGASRIEGQIAFARAASKQRRDALRWARRSLEHDPKQVRAYAALAVASGLVSPTWLVRRVQRTGRGL